MRVAGRESSHAGHRTGRGGHSGLGLGTPTDEWHMLGGTRIPLLLAGSAIESRLAAVAGIGLKARCGQWSMRAFASLSSPRMTRKRPQLTPPGVKLRPGDAQARRARCPRGIERSSKLTRCPAVIDSIQEVAPLNMVLSGSGILRVAAGRTSSAMPGRPMVGPRGFCWRRDRRRTAVLASRSTAAVTLLFMVVSLPSLSGLLAAGSPADRNQPVRPARRERGESDGADNLGRPPARPAQQVPPSG